MASQAIITDVGLAKITAASGNLNNAVKISHVALGDANGNAYDPAFTQTALVNERERRAIDWRVQTEPKTWLINVVFPADSTAAMFVREIGFFDEDGDLIAIVGGLAFQPRELGGYDYIVEQPLIFDRAAEGAVIVNAPDWELFDHAVLNLETHAIVAAEQFDQRMMIRDLQAAAN